MVSSTSLTISGSSAEVGSSNSMTFGFMVSARAIATRCCWPPDSWPGYLLGLLRNFHPLQIFHRRRFGILLRDIAHPDRRQRAVFQHRQMREQVEALEHHADFAPDLVDAPQIGPEFDAVDDDLAFLELLQRVDAADQRRFARARRTADHDALALGRHRDRCRAARGNRRTTCCMAGDLDGDRRFAVMVWRFDSYCLPLVPFEPTLDEQRIARHAETEDEIDHAGEGKAGKRASLGVAQFGSLKAAATARAGRTSPRSRPAWCP